MSVARFRLYLHTKISLFDKQTYVSMNIIHKLFFLIITLSIADVAHAEMIVEHYGMSNGLPNSTVYGSLKDKDGFLWFGTWHGLCSFDGTEFTPFVTRYSKKSDIPPRKVMGMVEDGKGYLWIRNADNHLYLFDKRTDEFRDTYAELKRMSQNVQVISLQRMDNGNVLLLTRNKNLYEAQVDKNGSPVFRLLFNGGKHTDPATLRLRKSVLGETADRIYWMDRRLNIGVMVKKHGRRLFGNSVLGSELTCFQRVGQYLCVGTATGDVYVADVASGRTEHYAFDGLKSQVSCIVPLDGRIYVSAASGFYSFTKGGSLKRIAGGPAGAETPFVDKYGKLWMNIRHRSVVCYDPQTDNVATYVMPGDSLVKDIKYCDAGANGLFVLTLGGELWRYDRLSREFGCVNVDRLMGISSDGPRFFDIDLDSDGRLWLSSATDGVYKISFPHNSFRFLFSDILGHGSINEYLIGVRSVYQSRGGDLWIGTRGGDLYCMDARTGKVKHLFAGIGSVYHIMEDLRGSLWLSTKGDGLIRATPDAMAPQGIGMTHYRVRAGDKYSISSDRVYYTYQDARGRIWVCTFDGGLNLIEEKDGRVIFRNKHNGFIDYPKYDLYMNVRSITEDRNGRLWVGTTDGLMSFVGKFSKPEEINFETYRDRGGTATADNDISTLYKDSRGDIWMGIFGCGLNKLEAYDARRHQPVLKSYGFIDQQSGDVVTSIIEDSHHCLWVCTENGLASLAHGSSYLRSYDRFAGFPVVNIEDNTSIATRDGRILIGCRQGLLSFSPLQVERENNRRYKTFIVNLDVLNRSVKDFDPPIYSGSLRYVDEIVLKHNQNMFDIEFATLTYTDPERIAYAYILDGYEERWHNNGNNRIASYANVPPGHYKFRVKPIGGDSPERVLTITILPPWWATWWAYLIYILVALSMLYGSIKLVLYMIRMRNEVYINDRLAELKIRFFTNVSHELRTPLTLIKGPIEELKNSERLSDTGREYLSLIDRNANKMLQLVNQILDFRKIQNGKMKMHVSFVNISDMLDVFRSEYRVMAEERDIAFRFEMPQERVMMWCDAEKIGIIISNLINNAFKYTHVGGTICVSLEYDEADGLCRIRVEDDGVGIPKEQLGEIFERFSQADNRTDSTSAGTGIGLSLSREFVNMHHGRIWAENVVGGRGVAFTIELPVDKEHFSGDIEVCIDDAGAEAFSEQSDLTEEDDNPDLLNDSDKSNLPGILIIEDNADLCRMMHLQLKSDYNIYTATNGETGLENIYRYRPDIIITDLMMPGMDGMELLKRVRQDFNVSHTPIIVLTAKHSEEDKLAAVAAGANAYITKPFSSSYLMARIRQLLEEQRIFQRKMVLNSGGERDTEAIKDEYERHLVQKDVEFVRKIYEIIEQNLTSNDFNINTISETIGLSRSAFFKKLKSLTGFAPVDLVKEIRLTKAAKMIETTDDSITAIAYSVGFRDAGYFGKCFRQKYGKTPKDYRMDFR